MYKNNSVRVSPKTDQIYKINFKSNLSPKVKSKSKIALKSKASPEGSPKTINYSELVKIHPFNFHFGHF